MKITYTDITPRKNDVVLHIGTEKKNLQTVQNLIKGVTSDTEYDLTIRPKKSKRSLDANALYWAIVGDISRHLGISNAEAHNTLLARYGVLQRVNEQVVTVLLSDEANYLQDEKIHLKATSKTKEKDGNLFRYFLLMKGSSEYNTAEMSRLIDGAISEAHEMGIWTHDEDYNTYKKGD